MPRRRVPADPFETPPLQRLMQRQALSRDELTGLTSKHGVAPELLSDLLDLVFTRYRFLDPKGAPTALKDEIGLLIQDAAEGGDA